MEVDSFFLLPITIKIQTNDFEVDVSNLLKIINTHALYNKN